jgi:uncharacterized protein (DUF2062 family)
MKQHRSFLDKCYNKLIQTFIDPLTKSRNNPHFDALGVSLGLIIGFLIPVGGQLACLGLIRLLFRFNVIVAAAFTLVSNPLNMIPLYYGYYLLGSLVIGKPDHTMELSSFEAIMTPIMNADYFWESLGAFLSLSHAFLVRWLIAAVILSVVFGVLGYLITYKIQKRRVMEMANTMGMEYQSLLKKFDGHQDSG